MLTPPRIDYYGDTDISKSLKGKALGFYQFVAGAMGGVPMITRDQRVGNSIIRVNISTSAHGDKNGTIEIFTKPVGDEELPMGFLYLHRWTAEDEAANATHVAGALSGRHDLLVTDKTGFKGIYKGVPHSVGCGTEYWTDGINLISWLTNISTYAPYFDNDATYIVPWDKLTWRGRFDGSGQLYVNGSKAGFRNPSAIYAAKVGRHILVILDDGVAFNTMYTNLSGTGHIYKTYNGMTIKKVNISQDSTKMVVIANIPYKPPPFTFPIGYDYYTNYWEAVVEYAIIQTGNPSDPINLVETSRIEQYGMIAVLKNTGGVESMIYGTGTTLITDAWYDKDGLLKTEFIDSASFTSDGVYSYTINNPYLTPVTVSVSCGADPRSATGAILSRNNYYIENCWVQDSVVTGTKLPTPASTTATITATRYDALGKLTFLPISDRTSTSLGNFSFGKYPYHWLYGDGNGFPYGEEGDTAIGSYYWQLKPRPHKRIADAIAGNEMTLSDRFGNKLYLYPDGNNALGIAAFEIKPVSEFDPTLEPFTPVSAEMLAIITAAIHSANDIIGVI